MNRIEFKKAMSGVQSSEQTIERIMDMPNKHSKKRFKIAPALALAACLTIIITGIFGSSAITTKIAHIVPNDNNSNTSIATPNENKYFTITAYAEEGKAQNITKSSTYTMQDSKIKAYYDKDGYYTVKTNGSSSFEVNGENIKTVRYQCEKGDFGICIDYNKKLYLEKQNKYYDAIIPYSAELQKLSGTELTKTVFKNYENGKYDEYFNNKKPVTDFIKVEKVYDDNEKITGVGFVSLETYHSISSKNNCKDFTFTNYMNFTENFNFVYWSPNTDALFTKDGKSTGVTFDEIEHDTLKVTVEFNDGSTQTASYDLGFNADGNLVIQKIV